MRTQRERQEKITAADIKSYLFHISLVCFFIMSSNDGVGLNSQLSTKELLPNNHGNGNGNGKKKKRRKKNKNRRHTNISGEYSDAGFYQAGLAGAGSISATDILVNSIQQRVNHLAATDLALSSTGEGNNYDGSTDYYPNVDVAPVVGATTTAAATATEPRKIGFLSMFYFSTLNEKILMIVGLFSAAIAGLAMPVWLLLLAKSLETFNDIGTIVAAGGDISILQDEMNKLIYSFAIVGAVTLVSGTCYVAIWSYTGETQTLRIQKAFVTSALRQEAAWYDTHHHDPQELPVLAANGLSRIQTSLGRAVADTFSNLLSAIGCLMVSLGLDPPLALFMLCVLPIIAIIIGIVSCYMRRSSGKALSEFASAGAFASEVLTGIKTIASLRAENWAVEQYTEYATQAQKYSIQSQILSKLASGLMGLLFYITYTFAFVFGTEQAASRVEIEQTYLNPFACMFRETDCGISGSEVMVCIYGVILTAQFIALMNPGINAINLGRTAAVDIYGTIHRTPAIDGTDNVKGTKLLGNSKNNNHNDGSTEFKNVVFYDGSMEFKNVVFSYPSRPGDLIFANFSLKIKAGTAVALVGPSGSGKSTLSKLLLRLYDPIGGHVMAGGVPLTELNLKWWRSQIGYVAQEPSLFPGSIRDNIAAGKLDGIATNEEVIEAAMAASAHEFITDLPDGYVVKPSNVGSSVQK
jgi:ATP-binding cassette subfamily B (MDR/TAP) protein 1